MIDRYKHYWQKIKPSLKVFGSVTWVLTKLGIVFVIAAFLGGVGLGTGMAMGALRDVPAFDPEQLERPFLPSYIYDINGDLITEIHDAENRIPITMADVPEHLYLAFLAAEDHRFEEHPGIDIQGFLRAMYTNLRTGSSHGASTISQQVIKQVFLTSKQTISRKIQELYLALNMEGKYTKQEIFEFYINNATFYGNNAWGVEAAAQTYFSKSVGELTLSEAALLAGIPNFPTYYSPSPENMEPSIKRRDDVLKRMLRFGYITEEEFEAAVAEEIVLNMQEPKGWPYPHYVDAVVFEYAIKILLDIGYCETEDEAAQAIRRDGLHIYTALDPRVQKVVEDVMFSDEYYPKDSFVYPEGHAREGRRYPQGAAVVMEASTGKVLAAVGGREYNSTNRINRIFRGFQPGSSIKPVIVYGPAFEYGLLSPASVLDDSPTVWPDIANEWYAPENYARSFRGMVTVRDAVTISDNIPAIKAFEMVGQQVGPRAATDFAKKLGLDLPDNSYSMLTSAIGGSNYLVTPLQMTQAYSAFANQGKVSEPIFVTKIIDRNGEEIFTAVTKTEVVMKEETAFMITSVLRDVVTRGTARPANLTKYNVVAKTGTTDDAHDRWTVGYSRDYVFTVWMGNDNKQVTVDGKKVKVPGLVSNTAYNRLNYMFGDIVKGTIGKNDKPFPSAPSGVSRATVCRKSGLLPSPDCPSEHLVTDWVLRGKAPKEVCNLHVRQQVCEVSGLLPTEYCPREHVVEKVFFNRPEFILTDERWAGGIGRGPADASEMPPIEYCTEHGPGSVTYSLKVTPQAGGMSLSWEVPGENLTYVIYRKDFNSNEFVQLTKEPITGNQYLDAFQPLPGMTYKYKVISINAEGAERSLHEQAEAQRPLALNASGRYEDGSVILDWDDLNIPIQGGNVAGYKVYRDGTEIGKPSASEFTDNKNIEPGKTYQYRISVIYKIGSEYESAKTAPIPVTIESSGNGNGNGNGNGGNGNGDNGDENGENVNGESGDGNGQLGHHSSHWSLLVTLA